MSDMPDEYLLQFGRRVIPFLEGHIYIDAFSFDLVRISDCCCLCNSFMADQRRFDFSSADPVPGDIDDVVYPAHEPVVAVLVHPGAVTGEVFPGNLEK